MDDTASETTLPEHASENRDYWNGRADQWVDAGERAWAAAEPYWGIWQLGESQLGLLPEDMTGLRAVELGCGTGYVSSWMARRGADVVGIDISAEQLTTARRLAAEHELSVTWMLGSAEQVSEPDASFDFAISELGAAIWCDPYRWIPEAARLLRPGGRLVFLGCHPLASICTDEAGESTDTQLHRDWFGLHELDWRHVEHDPGGIEFNLTFSAWLRLFRDAGFVVDEYLELQAPDGPDEQRFTTPRSWGRRFPAEQVWKLTRA